MTSAAPDDEARARLIAAIRAAKNRPLLPFRKLSQFETREQQHHVALGITVSTVLVGSTVVTTVAAVLYRYQLDAMVVVGLVALLSAACSLMALISTARAARLLRQQNPVLVEARHRGDYADFAEQLRRGSAKWRTRDIRRALPLIDQWASESGQV